MADKTVGIAMLGCGVVGGGVARILREQRELLKQRTGVTFDMRHVVVRDANKARGSGEKLPLTTDANAAIDDPKVHVVVELIGGTGAAAQHVERALKAGKHVVTANKSLLAARGPELFTLAKKHNACIAFEASAGGGIPIIHALMHGLVANRIDALVGIVNGTCNVILTRMTRNGWTYAEALAEAQRAGFAEADPTLDVSGRDAAQKLALLSGLGFNVRVREEDIHVEGIDTLQTADIKFADELGYVIKLLAIAERHPGNNGDADSFSLRVHPTLVHEDDVLAEVSGGFNAISVFGNALGHALFYGRGAGQMPTASAVVADLLDVAMGTGPAAFAQLRIFPDSTPAAKVLPFQDLKSRYYLRLTAKDQPGVLAQVTKILGDQGISLSAILQHEVNDDQFVPVIITTHLAQEGAMQAALKAMDALPTLGSPTVCLRIIDQPKEFAAAQTMKYAIIIPDGAADEPLKELGGKTPLEVAKTPNMDRIVAEGRMGLVRTVPDGFESGSDVATMCLLGYAPKEYHTGRAPLEAAAQRIPLTSSDWVFRCNLVTVANGIMKDHSAGGISDAEAARLIKDLAKTITISGMEFHTGVSYRNLLVYRGKEKFDVVTKPPHEFPEEPTATYAPRGTGSEFLNLIIAVSKDLFANHEVNRARRAKGQREATQVWLWGQGHAPDMPTFEKRFGVGNGTMITGVDLLRGLAVLLGWSVTEVAGMTSFHDTNYAGQGVETAKALDRHDLVFSHVESPDEASHQADWKTKIEAIEAIDRHVVGPTLEKLRTFPHWRMLVMPDHPTLISNRKHGYGPPCFAMAGTGVKKVGGAKYSERTARESDLYIEKGEELMEYFLRGGGE